MPSGLPPPGLLTSRKVRAFTLDTSVIRAAGFRFEQGALRQLAHQVPPWLSLWLSSIVVDEIGRQRLANLQAAADQAKQAWGNLHRHLDRPGTFDSVDGQVDQLALHAEAHFDDQVKRFLGKHAGEVVGLDSGGLAAQMFAAYFAGVAPFSGSGKKHEFPDAAALMSLEAYAAQRDVCLLAVSVDEGWHAYCSTSEHIYCLHKLSDLAELFRSTGPDAHAVRGSLSAYFETSRPMHELNLAAVIREGLRGVEVHTAPPERFAAIACIDVVDVRLTAFHVDHQAVGVWLTTGARGEGAAEMAVDCTVELDLRFFDPAPVRLFGATARADEVSDTVVRALPLNLALELNIDGVPPSMPDAISRISLVPVEYRLRLEPDEIPASYRHLVPFLWDEADVDDDLPF